MVLQAPVALGVMVVLVVMALMAEMVAMAAMVVLGVTQEMVAPRSLVHD